MTNYFSSFIFTELSLEFHWTQTNNLEYFCLTTKFQHLDKLTPTRLFFCELASVRKKYSMRFTFLGYNVTNTFMWGLCYRGVNILKCSYFNYEIPTPLTHTYEIYVNFRSWEKKNILVYFLGNLFGSTHIIRTNIF